MKLTVRTARAGFSVALLVLLVACGGSGSDKGTYSPDSSGTATRSDAGTLKDQITALESNQTLPKLDRSSDITGPDTNGNGVRDDIETWISTQELTDKQRNALMQKARALQKTLVLDLSDKVALNESGDELMAAGNCGASSFPNFDVYYEYARKVEAMTANTRERIRQYMRYNAASSGSSNTLPSHDTCEP